MSEAEERGGGAAGVFGGAGAGGQGSRVRGIAEGVAVEFAEVGEDRAQGFDGEGEEVRRDEPDAGGARGLERVEALGDVGARHPEGEGFERGVVFLGESGEGGVEVGSDGGDERVCLCRVGGEGGAGDMALGPRGRSGRGV